MNDMNTFAVYAIFDNLGMPIAYLGASSIVEYLGLIAEFNQMNRIEEDIADWEQPNWHAEHVSRSVIQHLINGPTEVIDETIEHHNEHALFGNKRQLTGTGAIPQPDKAIAIWFEPDRWVARYYA